LIVILCGGPHSAVTQLRVNPLCESSFLEVHLALGVTCWVSTHAPQSLVTCPGGVSTFLSYHARGSPLVMALSWVVSIPGSPSSGGGTSRVRIPPIGARTYGLEATLFFSLLLFWTVEARGLLAESLLGDASLGWRLSWAMPQRGDDFERSTYWLSSLGPLKSPTTCWLWPLVNARGQDGTNTNNLFDIKVS